MSKDLSSLALAQAELRNGYHRRARLILERDCEDDPPVLLELGLLAYRQGLVESALKYYDLALAVSDEISLIHGLRSLTLEALGKSAEAYKAWLLYDESGLASLAPRVPELDRFRPCGLNFWNFDIRYGALCLDAAQSSTDGFSSDYLASDFEIARAIHRLELHYRIGGWPLVGVIADQDCELAAVVAKRLNLPLLTAEDGRPCLHFAMTPDALRSFSCDGVSFAMFGYGLGDRDSPDILGVAAQKPMRWSGDCADVSRILAGLWLKSEWKNVEAVKRMHRYLRPCLSLRAGWEDRIASLPTPSPAQLVDRIGDLSKDALDWCNLLKIFTTEISCACWEAMQSCEEGTNLEPWISLILRCPDADWRGLLLLDSSSAWVVRSYVESKMPEETLSLVALCIEKDVEKASAVRIALEAGLRLQGETLLHLNLLDEEETELWFRHQSREDLNRYLRNPLLADEALAGSLAVYADAPDARDIPWLRECLFRRRPDVAQLALTCLEKLEDRTCLPDLVKLANKGAQFALPALARMGYAGTEDLAVECLVRSTATALNCLTSLNSARALHFVRKAPFLNSKGLKERVAYLDLWGEDDEEFIENYLSYPDVRLWAARALIRRGHDRYWEVFNGEKCLDPFHGYLTVAEFLLEWGTAEAVAYLMAWKKPENVLSEVLLTNRDPDVLALANRLLAEAASVDHS